MICQGLGWENDFKDKSLIEKYNISFKVRFFLKNFQKASMTILHPSMSCHV